MSEFIEVHDQRGEAMLVNLAQIESIGDVEGQAVFVFATPIPGEERDVPVQETYEEVLLQLGWHQAFGTMNFCPVCGGLLVDGRCTMPSCGWPTCSADAADEDPPEDPPEVLRATLTCLWSILSPDDRQVVRNNYPELARVAARGFVGAAEAQDAAIKEATEESETDGE
jgi:hypothetical protein